MKGQPGEGILVLVKPYTCKPEQKYAYRTGVTTKRILLNNLTICVRTLYLSLNNKNLWVTELTI